MKNRIIQLFQKKKSWSLKNLEKELQCTSSNDFIELIKALNELEEERILCNNHSYYFLIDGVEFVIGKVRFYDHSMPVLISETSRHILHNFSSGSVLDNDEVLIQFDGKKTKLIKVYNRALSKITGVFRKRKSGMYFYTDLNLRREVQISNLDSFSCRPGMKAVLVITKYANPLVCKIEQILGYENEKGVDITAILIANNVRMKFSEKVQTQTDSIPSVVQSEERDGREDYRSLKTVTIDGDDAKDFDDAISIEKTNFGYRLYVHIADVSHYVQEGSAIDQEAYARSTSIYVADRVIPMLPFALSNGICSLNPNVDRCTMTCVMDIDARGKCISHKIVSSLIYSDKRCTYQKVNAFFENDPMALEEYEDIKDLLWDFYNCAKLLQKQSHQRGTIDFNTKEPFFILDSNGKCIDVQCKKRGFSEQMIEEAMILANVCVAKTLNDNGIPGIYRVHESPDSKKVASLASTIKALGIKNSINYHDIHAKDIQTFLESLETSEFRDIVAYAALRTMSKARYDAKCLGHFGLALSEYCHFTSPIRRYPDLVVHRMLRRYLLSPERRKRENDQLKCERQAYYVSKKEMDAVTVERQVADYKKAQYMESRVGEIFDGQITSVQSFGFFVSLDNTVEGLVPIQSLYDDYYNYDEDQHCLVGEHFGYRYRIGQKLQVLCSEVDVSRGKITFSVQSPKKKKKRRK